MDQLWKQITPSDFAWEQEGLDFLKRQLPDHEPYRVWANFEFIAQDGSINEVDALVLTPKGLYLVEIKSHPGEISGDAGSWVWTCEGRRRVFDNPRAVQVRLKGFDLASLCEVGGKVRDLYAAGSTTARIGRTVDDGFIVSLAGAVIGQLGGKVGIAPRVFLKKLVADVLDRVDQFDDFDPRRHYALTLDDRELTPVERAARSADGVDDIELDL